MSGEYYCIEEVDPTAYYRGDYDQKSTKSSRGGQRSFLSHDNDARSTTSRKSQDLRLYEIEEQLQVAENRCNTLKGQLDSMKKIYQKSTKSVRASTYRRTETSLNRKSEGSDNTVAYKSSRKRPSSPPPHQRSRPSSPTKRRTFPQRSNNYESTDSIPQQSSGSSTALIRTTVPLVRPKDFASSQLTRQKCASIGTDTSGAAVRTINNILTGITESVNRLSKIHIHDKKSKKKVDSFTGVDVATTIFTVPIKSFVQQNEGKTFRKKSEMVNNLEMVNEKTSTEDCDLLKFTTSNVRAKTPAKTKWSRHTSSKARTKIQSSSGSVNLAKSIKSTIKHTETNTKIKGGKSGIIDEDSQSVCLPRKRKRSVKRLKQASKVSVGKKFSDHGTQKHYDDYDASDNLVELYHNIAAKGSDSGESNAASKSHLNRQKGGGDLVMTPVEVVVPKLEVIPKDDADKKKIVARVYQSQRMLAPINENTLMDENCNSPDCFSTTMNKNYELPTIASKMKQVSKSYFHGFNFRSIPFCAAKSITPSHNIGINIQQVMSIMKTRQPITGISATLAHNISLAAEKLQSRPLSVLVSTLSSRMGFVRLAVNFSVFNATFCRYGGGSQCPLIKGTLNRDQLQEMAKEIPEEAEIEEVEEAQVGEEGEERSEYIIQNENSEAFVRGPSGDREGPDGTTWSLDPTTQRRCTCASQKGVPFQHVLSKYQIPAEPPRVPSRPKTTKSAISRRYTRTTIDPLIRKEATKNWVKNDASQAVVVKKSEGNTLQGRERNLKTVLVNLHDEFDALNTKYENLAKSVDKENPETNKATLKELESMEGLLNKKEEEINMVMALYTEVLALKDQVKKLKDRASQPSLTLAPKVSSEYKNPNAALHLTQLLRQIQQYQMRYKTKV